MSWLAIVLAVAIAAAAGPVPKRQHHRVSASQRVAKHAPRHTGIRIKRPAAAAPHPSASPVPVTGGGNVVLGATPTPTATAAPTATPTATPVYPSRTQVILNDDPWSVTSSYQTLRAGPLEFNVVNHGSDDHNLTIRGVDGAVVAAPPDGETYPLEVTLAAGTYTLYCSLPQHEQLGMWTTLTVK